MTLIIIFTVMFCTMYPVPLGMGLMKPRSEPGFTG